MIKFLIFFGLLQLFLFALQQVSFVHSNFIIPFTEGVAHLSALIIQLFDDKVTSQGVLLQQMENGFAVSIQSGCNGVEAVIVLVSAMLVFPSSWKLKCLGMVTGFLAVEILNIIRIITLFYIGQWDQEMFEWAHLYIWEALIMLDVLIIFLWWIRLVPVPEKLAENYGN